MNVPSPDSRRRRRSQSEVQDVVHPFPPSGLSITDFAARMGVHPMSVRRWIRISSSQASVPDSNSRFIPVPLRQPDVTRSQGLAAEIIHPGGRRLRFPSKRPVKDMVPIIDGYEKIAGS